jgi:hypothetical protein
MGKIKNNLTLGGEKIDMINGIIITETPEEETKKITTLGGEITEMLNGVML